MSEPDDLVLDLDDIDHIRLGTGAGTRSPGTCKLNGFGLKPKWDVKEADGQVGASSSLKGFSIRQGTIDFYLVHDGSSGSNDFEDWRSFRRLVESTINGKTPTALPIYHPDLADAGLTEVCLGPDGISLPLYDGRGGVTYSVSFIEYKPPKKKPAAKATPKPSANTQTYANTDEGPRYPPPKPDPNQAAKDELAELQREASQP